MTKRFKRLMAALLAILFVLSLAGCGGGSQPSSQDSKSKQIVIARPEDSNNLDPVVQDGNVNIWIFNLAMEGLVKTDDAGKKIVPCLAESWEISKDGLVYTFRLKKGVKFSDGTPVKGEDWVFSLIRARDTKGSPWKFALEGIQDVKAPDDNTLVITLKEPWAPILADLAMFNATVTSKAYYDKVGAEAYSQKPLGTGPYYFAEWKKGEYVLLKKNPHYWVQGTPKADEIKFIAVPDDNTRIMQLQAGTVDAVTFVPFNRMAELKNDAKLTVSAFPSTETRYILINTTKKPFDSTKVRQALAYATDRPALIKIVLYGFGEDAVSFMPRAGTFWNDQIKGYSYDVEKAKQLLAEAGYASGFNMELLVRAGNTVEQQIATVLKEQWSKIGVNVNISLMEAATATTKYRNLDYEITLRAWTNDMADASQLVDYACIFANRKNFFTGWKNDQVEQWAQQAKRELDENKRKELYFKIQAVHTEEASFLAAFHVPYPVAMKKSVAGFVQTPLGNYRFEQLEKK